MRTVRALISAAFAIFLLRAATRADGGEPIVLADLQEQSIPAGDLTPTPMPSLAPGQTPLATPSPTPTNSEVFHEPTLQPQSEEVAPLEAGSLTPSLRISDSSLQNFIVQERDPARAASMRTAEQARAELLDGHPDGAIRDLGRAVSIDPSDPYAYFYLGRAYIARQNYPQAMTFLKRAEIGFGSRNPLWLSETLAFEGLTYEESGHTVAAAAAYQQALQVNPGNLMARVGYTRLAPSVTPEAPGGASSSSILPPPPASPPPPPPASAPAPLAPR